MVSSVQREKGQVLAMALIAMAAGVMIIGPLLSYLSTGLQSLQKETVAVREYYAADAGVEHSIWRVRYGGLVTDYETPFNYVYSTVNDLPITITITKLFYGGSALCGDNLPPNPTTRATIARTIVPPTAPAGVPTVFTYTITFENIGTSTLHFEEIGYELPSGFIYENGSAGGYTTADPTIDGTILAWTFSAPHPKLNKGEQFTETFRATGTLIDGNYCTFCDGAWVVFVPEDVGCVMANGGERYNIRTVTGSTFINTAIGLSGGDVIVLSWDTK